MEEAKFTYSRLGKAFEKQAKNQVEKQIKAIKEHGKQLVKSSKEKESLTHKKIVWRVFWWKDKWNTKFRYAN